VKQSERGKNVKATCTLLTERHSKVNSSPLRTYSTQTAIT